MIQFKINTIDKLPMDQPYYNGKNNNGNHLKFLL